MASSGQGLLKGELARRNLGYRDLAQRLEALGIHENERNSANKISRGGFSAAFFVQCLRAVRCTSVQIGDYQNILSNLLTSLQIKPTFRSPP